VRLHEPDGYQFEATPLIAHENLDAEPEHPRHRIEGDGDKAPTPQFIDVGDGGSLSETDSG
jgi:hypothetical protein